MDSRRLGHLLLVSAGLALGFHIWLSKSVFVAVQRGGDGPDHLFISASVASLIALAILSTVAVYVVHLILWLVAARHGATSPVSFSIENATWAKPLLLFWASALAFLTVAPGASRALSVLASCSSGAVARHARQGHRKGLCRVARHAGANSHVVYRGKRPRTGERRHRSLSVSVARGNGAARRHSPAHFQVGKKTAALTSSLEGVA